MKRIMTLTLTLLLFASTFAAELELGSKIPLADVKMGDVSGKNVSLNDAMGDNGLLVVFSCNTCPFVDAWEDRYIKVSNEYQEKGSYQIGWDAKNNFGYSVSSGVYFFHIKSGNYIRTRKLLYFK